LGSPSQAARTDYRTGRQILDSDPARRDQGISRVLAIRHSRDCQVRRHRSRQILGRVHSQVNISTSQGCFQLSREKALAPDGLQGFFGAVAAGDDGYKLGLKTRTVRTDGISYDSGLTPGKDTAARSDSNLFLKVHPESLA
jgi:hypothetical protein